MNKILPILLTIVLAGFGGFIAGRGTSGIEQRVIASGAVKAAAENTGCARAKSRDIALSGPNARDVLEATARGKDCDSAIVTVTLRDAEGRPSYAYAQTFAWFPADIDTSQGVTAEQMDAFLERLIAVEPKTADTLTAWPASKASIAQDDGFFFMTPLPRDQYERYRAQRAPLLCHDTGIESGRCLVYDGERGEAVLATEFGS